MFLYERDEFVLGVRVQRGAAVPAGQGEGHGCCILSGFDAAQASRRLMSTNAAMSAAIA